MQLCNSSMRVRKLRCPFQVPFTFRVFVFVYVGGGNGNYCRRPISQDTLQHDIEHITKGRKLILSLDQTMTSQETPYTSPLRARYGASFLCYLEKRYIEISRVDYITIPWLYSSPDSLTSDTSNNRSNEYFHVLWKITIEYATIICAVG